MASFGSRHAQGEMAPSKSMTGHTRAIWTVARLSCALAWIFRLEDFTWSGPVELDHVVFPFVFS